MGIDRVKSLERTRNYVPGSEGMTQMFANVTGTRMNTFLVFQPPSLEPSAQTSDAIKEMGGWGMQLPGGCRDWDLSVEGVDAGLEERGDLWYVPGLAWTPENWPSSHRRTFPATR